MPNTLYKKLINIFFYGNYFAGLCAVFLCMETSLQHGLTLNGIHFYTIIFLGTAYYYRSIYLRSINDTSFYNERSKWYYARKNIIKKTQTIIFVFLVVDVLFFVGKYYLSFTLLNNVKWGLILLFPLIAFMYTFNILPFPHLKRLRRVGWLKPFILGFIWSGIVTVYPIIFHQLQVGNNVDVLILPSGWLWLKNMMFISTLCIMFDIKDYDHDKASGLKTFAVQFGIQPTIRFIIIPLVLLGLFSFFMFTINRHYQTERIALNAIPYILLLISAFSLYKKRSIIYYLSVIDGLMIVKAVCGIAGMLLIK